MNQRRGMRPPNRHERRLAMHRSDRLREMPSVPFYEATVPEEFARYATAELLAGFELKPRKRERQVEVAICCLNAAVLAELVGACVADTRDQTKPGVRMRVAMWDAAERAGLVVKHVGSEMSGMQTRYLATAALTRHFVNWPLRELTNLELTRNTMRPNEPTAEALVLLKKSRKRGGNLLPLPDLETATTIGDLPIGGYLERVENKIEKINRSNLRHTWEAFKTMPDGRLRATQPNVCIKQQHIDELMRYARLYTWGPTSAQNFTVNERRLMKIDGEPVAELDYASMNLRMVYHLRKIDIDADEDTYRTHRVLPEVWGTKAKRPLARLFVKRATNVMLNTTSRKAAELGVRGLLYRNKESRFWAAMLRAYDLTPSDIVKRIEEAHPQIADRFFIELGAWLQTFDGMVMLRVMGAFAIEDRPVLGIHDGLICRASDAEFAVAMMQIHYHVRFGYLPVVRRVY
ncbi:hypothetical protein SH528x_002182 [Novipirellula sp. SH528]|uniref:hypothetical protein n=1 Tax=Novipirellula sp. SH528 TaxID=3454466 RepID=UPI003FA0350B